MGGAETLLYLGAGLLLVCVGWKLFTDEQALSNKGFKKLDKIERKFKKSSLASSLGERGVNNSVSEASK